MDISKILVGALLCFIGQIGSFLQLQGAIKFNWYGKYMWVILLCSIPITWIYIKSVNLFVEGFGGQIWPSRLLGFAIGIIVFTLFSIIIFHEHLSLKTILCLLLSIGIISVQVFMK